MSGFQKSENKREPIKHEPMKTPKGTLLPLLDLRGKPYLQVPHRIVWFREEHPDWVIEVGFTNLNEGFAMARAEIRDTEGKIRAVAHKVEHKSHFIDYVEKAETGAIGRALAMIGYGTQFAPELEEGDRIVDTPIAPARKNPPPQQQRQKKQDANIETSYEPNGDPGISDIEFEGDPAELVINFGKKFKGKKLREVSKAEIESFLGWLKDNSTPGTILHNNFQTLRAAYNKLYPADQSDGDVIPF